ncbi:MAG: c-type cytochrome [Bryobacterales bacterium]|nr:c-type cytochrome [Bryobacterales bacterium]MBV9399363.1 c-type cytochrome [Bryobacterales bacterium]
MRRVGLAVLTAAVAFGQAGPARPEVDTEAAERGKHIYLQFCVNCHGNLAKGTDQGPDLIRSVVVLQDREGGKLGPALIGLPNHKRDLTKRQLADVSQFLKQRIEETSKNRNAVKPPNVLTGDAKAGQAYFGAKCAACHSPSGDLAGIARKYDPVTLQQRFLFPRSGGRGAPTPKRPQVTVTPASGEPVTGALERIDDFSVSLRDASGEYRSWKRNPDLRVDVVDPYSAHNELLDEYTDADMHNVVAYLETLK